MSVHLPLPVTLPLPVSGPYASGRSYPLRSDRVVHTSPAVVRNRQRLWGECVAWCVAHPVASGIFVSVGIWGAVTLLWPSSPLARSTSVMPLGLPDLHTTFDALCFAAQAMADQGAPAAAGQPAAPVNVPNLPGFESMLINLGGWAAILYGLASNIGKQVDSRVAAIEVQLSHLSEMPRQVQLLRRELRRYRMTPGAHALPGKPADETSTP